MDDLRRLFRCGRSERDALLMIIPLTCVSAICAALQPWPIKLLFDYVFGAISLPSGLGRALHWISEDHERSVLTFLIALGSILIFFLQSATTSGIAWILATAGRRTSLRVAQELFTRLQHRSLLFHRRVEVGQLITCVMSDSKSVAQLIEKGLMSPALSIMSIAAMTLVMARYDKSLALLAILLPPAIIVGSMTATKGLRRAGELRRTFEGRLQTLVQQTLAGLPVIQAFAQEESIRRQFDELAECQLRTAKQTAVLNSFNSLASGCLSLVARSIVLWVGSRHILEGQLSLGSGALFISYFGVMLVRTQALADWYPNVIGLKASLSRVLEILRTEPDIMEDLAARPWPIRGIVRFEHVSAGYENGYPVLKDVSFEISQGEMVAIVGPSGAGKTTLLNLICRLTDPWEGSIKIDRRDVREFSLRSLRTQVGMVFQDPFLYSLSVAQNISFGQGNLSSKEIEEAAKTALAHEFILRLPQGYDTIIGSRGAILSLGMRQRIAIARSIVKNAPILVLDEPTSALDAQTERALLNCLTQLMRGKTVFIATHRVSTIAATSRILLFENGHLIEDGHHNELLNKSERYLRLLNTFHDASKSTVVASN
jgi:ATP-binding cassette subfamily B protein